MQEDLARLKEENRQWQAKEQQLLLRVRQAEDEQQSKVESSLRMVQEIDRYRHDLSLVDSEKRQLTRQISEREGEVNQLREELRSVQGRLESAMKTQDKKS